MHLHPVGPVPIYDICNHDGTGSAGVNENVYPALTPRELQLRLVYSVIIDNRSILGFTVSVPLKQFRHKDTPS